MVGSWGRVLFPLEREPISSQPCPKAPAPQCTLFAFSVITRSLPKAFFRALFCEQLAITTCRNQCTDMSAPFQDGSGETSNNELDLFLIPSNELDLFLISSNELDLFLIPSNELDLFLIPSNELDLFLTK
ncbi:hypothetical protein STEG23_015981 [Scotinomys teguina]